MSKHLKTSINLAASVAFTILIACSCNNPANQSKIGDVRSAADSSFSKMLDGKQVSVYQIGNKNMTARFTNYGARIVSLEVPDKNSRSTDVVVGFGSIEGYLNSTEPYFGATIGRYGNRINKGRFILDGKTYQITANNNGNALHGGKKGFQDVVWDAEQTDEKSITFTYQSKDGEEGFPGNLLAKVTYSITDDNELGMHYEATTDKKTVINLTNHAFFNLNGEGSGEILNHQVQIFADRYHPVDSTLIPLGDMDAVAGTPFDFRKPKTIGERILNEDQQLKYGKGYDHNYILNRKTADEMMHAATVVGDKSGIRMEIFTLEPGLQFYSGNFMAGKNTFKNGSKDKFRTAFAMETQHFPDSPNQPKFPSTVLNPGEKYHTRSIYKFSVVK